MIESSTTINKKPIKFTLSIHFKNGKVITYPVHEVKYKTVGGDLTYLEVIFPDNYKKVFFLFDLKRLSCSNTKNIISNKMDYTSFWLYYCNILKQYQNLFIVTLDSFDKNILLNGQASIVETSNCEGRKYKVGYNSFYIFFEPNKSKNISIITLHTNRNIVYIYSNDDFKDPETITNRAFRISNFFHQFLITSLIELKTNAAPIE